MSHHCLPAEQVLQDDLCQGGYVYWVGLINNQEFLAFLTKRKKKPLPVLLVPPRWAEGEESQLYTSATILTPT